MFPTKVTFELVNPGWYGRRKIRLTEQWKKQSRDLGAEHMVARGTASMKWGSQGWAVR